MKRQDGVNPPQAGARQKGKSQAALEAQCQRFNESHPIGAEVWYHPVIGRPECAKWKTASKAYVMSGHTAVVFLEGFRGCVALDALTDDSAALPAKPDEQKRSRSGGLNA
jgi:hypothetical protein